MIFDAARLAFQNLFAAETRSVFWKVLGLTLLVLAALWFAIRSIFIYFALPWIDALIPGVPDWAGWLSFVFAIFAGIGLALALALLISPVTAVIAGLFLDDVAEVVEKRAILTIRPARRCRWARPCSHPSSFSALSLPATSLRFFCCLFPVSTSSRFFW